MPLRATDAKKLIRHLMDKGMFVSPGNGTHVREEMEKDELTDLDAVNVLRAGIVDEAEFENRSWRHRVRTPKMVFVITFDPEPLHAQDFDVELVLVTAWRCKPG